MIAQTPQLLFHFGNSLLREIKPINFTLPKMYSFICSGLQYFRIFDLQKGKTFPIYIENFMSDTHVNTYNMS